MHKWHSEREGEAEIPARFDRNSHDLVERSFDAEGREEGIVYGTGDVFSFVAY